MKNKNICKKVGGILSVALCVAGAFLFSSCGKEDIDYGKFTEDEIVVSIGDEIEIANYYKVGNRDIQYVTSNGEILSSQDDLFRALKAGSTYIYSVYDGKNVDYIKITVKDAFAKPSAISVDNEGLLSWEKISISQDGQEVCAKYELEITDESENKTTVICDTNSYQFTEKGIYKVRVRCLENDVTLASEYSTLQTVYYSAMVPVSGLTFTASEEGSVSKGTLVWSPVENAKYNVIVGDLLFATTETSIEIDLTLLSKSSVNIYVESVDLDGNKKTTKSEVKTINKLVKPVVSYSNGDVVWNNNEHATKYFVKCVNTNTNQIQSFYVNENSTNLNNIGTGYYRVYVQAIGEEEYVNSAFEELGKTVYKLPSITNFTASLVDGVVTVKATTSEIYGQGCKIFANNVATDVPLIQEGNKYIATKTFNINEVGAYKYRAQLIADIGQSNEYYVVNSNKSMEYTFYKLGNTSNIAHELNGAGESLIIIDSVENAEVYSVKIGNTTLPINSVEANENRTTLNLGVIDKEALGMTDGSQFTISIIATRSNATSVIPSTTTKSYNILEAPTSTKLNGNESTNKNYTWNEIENAQYKYLLYKTGADYNVADITPTEITTSTPSTDELDIGFYVIRVYTLPNESASVNNVGSSSYLEDRFYVSTKLDQPYIVDFEYEENHDAETSGYKLTIEIPEDEACERSCIIGLKSGDTVNILDEFEVNGTSLIYRFANAYNFSSGTNNIVVYLNCPDADDAKIYKTSSHSVLKVVRLDEFTGNSISVDNNQILTLTKPEDVEGVEIKKGGSIIESVDDGTSIQLNVSEWVGENILSVKYLGYKTYTEKFTNSTIYLDSVESSINITRDETPTNFRYVDGTVSFDHNGKATQFGLKITITTDNGTKSWNTIVSQKTFTLESLKTIINNQSFNTYYTQKKQVDLEIYSVVNTFDSEVNKYYIDSKSNNAGTTSITITKLNTVTSFAYDKENNRLVWTSNNPDDTYYEVYHNNNYYTMTSSPLSSDEGVYTYVCSLNSLVINEGFDVSNKFYVVAKATNKMTSSESKEITIYKLKAINSLSIKTDLTTGKNYAEFTIAGSMGEYVSEILVNGVANTTKKIELSAETENITIQLIAITTDSTSSFGYLDSDETLFTLNKSNIAYTDGLAISEVDGRWLTWNKYDDITIADKLKYKIDIISSGNVVGSKVVENITKLDLNDNLFTGLSNGAYTIKMCAYTDNYNLINNGVGGYLYKAFETILNVQKYSAVGNVSFSYTGDNNTIDEEKNRNVKFEWSFDDTGLTGVKYKIKFVNKSGETVFDTIVTDKYYSIKQSEILGGGNLSITAYSDNNLYGEIITKEIKGYSISGATLYDTGKLMINGDAGKYIIELTYGATTKTIILEGANNISLNNYFDEVETDDEEISIRIIEIGQTNYIASNEYTISSRTVLGNGIYEISGNKIYFESENAEAVNIIYNSKTVSVTNKTTIYIPNAQTDSNYSYKVYSNKKEVGYTEKQVFVFEIPSDYTGTEFIYYFSENNGVSSSVGKINSYQKEVALSVSSLSTTSDINITIDDTYKPVAWASGSVSKLLVEIFNGSNLITTIHSDANKISLSDIEKNINLEVGTYTFKVYAISDYISGALSYSNDYTFTYEKKNSQVSGVEINNQGYLTWQTSGIGSYVINQTSIVNTNWFDIKQLGPISSVQVTKLGNIPFGTYGTSETGKYVTGSVVGNNFTYYVAGEPIPMSLSATSDFSLTQTIDGTIVLTPNDNDPNINVNIEYNNKVYSCESSINDTKINVRLIDIIAALGSDFEGGISSIKISTVKAGYIKSTSVQCNVNLETVPSSYTIEKIKGGESDYITEYTKYVSTNTFNYMVVRVYDGNTKIYDGIREINLTGNTGLLDINDLLIDDLGMLDGKTYTIKVAPIHKISGIYTQYNWLSESLTYYRLKAVSSLQHIYISNGYSEAISWNDENQDGASIGYYVVKTNYAQPSSTLGTESTLNVFDDKKIAYTEFDLGKYYTVGVNRISQIAGNIYSSREMYKDGNADSILIYRNKKLNESNFILSNGVLKIAGNYGANITGDISSQEAIDAIFESGNLTEMINLLNDYTSNEGTRNSFSGFNKYNSYDKVAKALLDAVITTPITFKLRNLANDTIDLRFVQSSTSIVVNVKAIQLMERLDTTSLGYIKALRDLLGNNTTEKIALNNVISLFENQAYFTGVACDEVLFDEMNNNGDAENVAFGEYSLYATQRGNTSAHTIRGEENKTQSSNIEVLAAPTMVTATENIVSDSKTIATRYLIKFNPIKDKNDNLINSYKLILRSTSNTIIANIDYVSSTWKLSFNSNELTLSTDLSGYVIIPLNTIGGQTGIDSILSTQDITYKASVYGLGTGVQFNSKSDVITISYLPINTISLVNGELCWDTVKVGNEVFNTSVFYKAKNNTYSDKETISTNASKAYYSMTNPGEYDALALYTQGRQEEFAIYVDSDVQLLQNVVKLYSPGITYSNNEVVLTDNVNNAYTSLVGYSRKYKVTDDTSKDYYLTEEVANVYNYIAGLNSYTGTYSEYKGTEQNATEFGFENIGSTVSGFEVSQNQINTDFGNVDILHLENPAHKIFLKSNKVVSNAEMMKATEISINTNGDFEWTEAEMSNVNASALSSDTNKVVYELSINKYTKNGDVYNLHSIQKEYTTATTLSSELITIPDSSATYYYSLAVVVNVYSSINNGLTSITTLEGEKYYQVKNAKYENGKYILKSETVTSEKIQRFPQVENLAVSGGYITWKYDKTINGYPNAKFEVWASVYSDGTQKELIEGEFDYKEGNVVTFDPIAQKELTDGKNYLVSGKTYYIWVKVVNNESEGVIANNISSLKEEYGVSFTKLKDFDRSCVTVSEDADGYILDFSGYTAYSGTNNYKLEVKVFDDTIELSSVNSVIKLYEIGYTGGSLSIDVLAKSTVNNVINAEQVIDIEFAAPSWTEEDSIAWDSTKQEFTWTLDGENTSDKYFDVEIVTVNTTISSGKPTTTTTTQKFSDVSTCCFKPITLGKIKTFNVYAKNSPSNFKSTALAYSCGTNTKFDLFASGDGTSESPYIINSAAQFANINYRSVRESCYQSYKEQETKEIKTSDTSTDTNTGAEIVKNIGAMVYYKQNADITVNVTGFAIEEFAGVYDGNSNALEIIGTGSYSKTTEFSNIFNYSAGTGIKSYSYNKIFSVFKKLNTSSEIKNLTYKFNYTCSEVVLIAGLAGENNGKISNIEIFSATITTNSYNPAISLLVGANNGQIVNCVNNANISVAVSGNAIITTMALNNSGTIERCINNGTISASSGNAIVTGIAFNNTGVISICGNNANLTSNGCVSGLVYQSSNGTIKYSWNTGAMESTATGKYESGIAYSCTGTTITKIFAYGSITKTSTKNILFEVFTSSTKGSCYTYTDTQAITNMNMLSLPESNQVAAGSSGYTIKLTKIGLGYSITFE